MSENKKVVKLNEKTASVVIPGLGEVNKDKIAAALALLERDARNRANQKAKRVTMTPEEKAAAKAKAAERRKNLTAEQKKLQKVRQARQSAKMALFIAKAKKAGITVSEDEINDEMAKRAKQDGPGGA